MQEIILEISADGEDVKVQAFGFLGSECELATAPLEQALGITQGEREYKPEFYAVQMEQERVRSGR